MSDVGDRGAMTYQLPFGEVFRTSHSTQECWRIAQDGLIVLSEIGSTMHGVSSTDTGDDLDLMGVCIEPPIEVLGLGTFEQYEYRDRRVNERSQMGDTDLVVYGLRKWARLAAAGNPTVLMLLFSHPSRHVRYLNDFGVRLREEFPRFLSRQAGQRFLGYLDGQLKRGLSPDWSDSEHVTRPELVQRYGWDTKTGYHALRLAIQGRQLMETGSIELPMRDDDRELLLEVRHGERSRDWVLAEVRRRADQLRAATESSRLPEKADLRAISAWLVDVQRSWWQAKGL